MRVTINGVDHDVAGSAMTYDQICRRAEVPVADHPSVTYRTYAGAVGTLTRGDVIGVGAGLTISVVLRGDV